MRFPSHIALVVCVSVCVAVASCRKQRDEDEDSDDEQVIGPVATGSSESTIRFEVTMPPTTPEDDVLYLDLRGPEARRMTRVGDRTFALELAFDGPASLQYAYSRNYTGFAAGEHVPGVTESDWDLARTVEVTTPGQVFRDEVASWRWLTGKEDLTVPLSRLTAGSWLPRISGLPFMGGYAMHDYWAEGFAELTARAAVHLKDQGARWVMLFPSGQYDDPASSEPTIDPEPSGQYDRASLRSQIRTFRAANLNVALAVGILNDAEAPAGKSEPYWDARFAAFASYLEDTARLAEEEGVGLISFHSHALLPGGQAPASNSARWNVAMQRIRSVFSGKIAYQLHMNSALDELFPATKWAHVASLFDMVGIVMWDGVSDQSDPTDAQLLEGVDAQFDRYVEAAWDTFHKPLFISQLAVPSAEDGHRGEDLYAADDPRIALHGPLEPGIATDFQIQARVLDAVMASAAARPYLVGAFVFGQPYWKSLDRNYGVWGKPAETILKAWYEAAP